MAFSYTEKKRIRRSFEKISSAMELPNLLATQLESYHGFLQKEINNCAFWCSLRVKNLEAE